MLLASHQRAWPVTGPLNMFGLLSGPSIEQLVAMAGQHSRLLVRCWPHYSCNFLLTLIDRC
jgi:hypothetical protein